MNIPDIIEIHSQLIGAPPAAVPSDMVQMSVPSDYGSVTLSGSWDPDINPIRHTQTQDP